jgi:hypothetical protein
LKRNEGKKKTIYRRRKNKGAIKQTKKDQITSKEGKRGIIQNSSGERKRNKHMHCPMTDALADIWTPFFCGKLGLPKVGENQFDNKQSSKGEADPRATSLTRNVNQTMSIKQTVGYTNLRTLFTRKTVTYGRITFSKH